MVVNIFKQLGIDKAKYLDVGAHHPSRISNTKLLYDLGWRGVNVEANPNLIQAFIEERPEDQNICVGIGPKAGTHQFLMYDKESGRNTFSHAEMKRYSQEHSHYITSTLNLTVITLTELILKDCGGVYPHFLSLDVEGLDYDILKATEFKPSKPLVICVETPYKDFQRFEEILVYKGYHFYCRLGENTIWVASSHINSLYN